MSNKENINPNISVELDNTFCHTITDFGFDCLRREAFVGIMKDGRPFSHFIEPWLAEKYPIIHISGCKKYDHTDKNDVSIEYDQKTFTSRGCKFMPSNMIGEGRTFNQQIFEEKAKKLIYIIVSNVDFPDIKVRFVRGTVLVAKYPKGVIPFKCFEEFFHPTF